MIFDELNKLDYSTKSLRKFGLTFCLIFFIISIILLFNNNQIYIYLIIIAILLMLITILIPRALIYFYKIWMTFALILGTLTSNIILTIFYFFVITPIGIFLRISGKDLLNLKFDKAQKSYWNFREQTTYKKESSEKQF